MKHRNRVLLPKVYTSAPFFFDLLSFGVIAKRKGQLHISYPSWIYIRLANKFTSPALTLSIMIADRNVLKLPVHAPLPTSPSEPKRPPSPKPPRPSRSQPRFVCLRMAYLVTVMEIHDGGCVAATPSGVASPDLIKEPNLLPKIVVASSKQPVSRLCLYQ